MNILHHKSWHVRNKDNIERVRRDEAKAAEEEKEKQKRIALAEQEARTDLLRNKAKQKLRSEQGELETLSANLKGHINLFNSEEEGQKQGKNLEYEAEKKEEKEKYEKSIGLLTYLGQSSAESQQTKPWYFDVKERTERCKEGGHTSKASEEFDRKKKREQDPLKHMTKYVETKRKHEISLNERSHGNKKHKKDRQSSTSTICSKSGKKNIEQLRAERLRREMAERRRAEELIAKSKGESIREKEVVTDERHLSYNSQFCPEFVRKPRNKTKYK